MFLPWFSGQAQILSIWFKNTHFNLIEISLGEQKHWIEAFLVWWHTKKKIQHGAGRTDFASFIETKLPPKRFVVWRRWPSHARRQPWRHRDASVTRRRKSNCVALNHEGFAFCFQHVEITRAVALVRMFHFDWMRRHQQNVTRRFVSKLRKKSCRVTLFRDVWTPRRLFLEFNRMEIRKKLT